MNVSGKTAPSFIATIALIAAAIAGYVLWGILSPNPIARSEMVVRDFSSAAAGELGSLRRDLREEVARYNIDPSTLESVRAGIDERAEEAREEIEMLSNGAVDELTSIDGIGLQTQDNRLQRIRKRTEEAMSRIDPLVAEARDKLPTGP